MDSWLRTELLRWKFIACQESKQPEKTASSSNGLRCRRKRLTRKRRSLHNAKREKWSSRFRESRWKTRKEWSEGGCEKKMMIFPHLFWSVWSLPIPFSPSSISSCLCSSPDHSSFAMFNGHYVFHPHYSKDDLSICLLFIPKSAYTCIICVLFTLLLSCQCMHNIVQYHCC